MKHKKIFMGIIIIIILATSISLLISKGTITEKTIKIGYVGVLSGPAAKSWGFDARDGAQLALDEINSKEDINLEIIWGDSSAKPEKGITEFKRMSDIYQPDVFIVDSSGVASAVASLQHKVPVIFGAVATIGITKQNNYLFRNFYVCDRSAPLLAENTYNKLNIKKVAILSQNEPYGQSCSTSFTESFKELGGTITLEEKFLPSEFDYRTQLTKIANTDAEAIYTVGYSTQLKEAIEEIKELNINKKILAEITFYSLIARSNILEAINPPEVYFTTTQFYLGSDKATEFKEKYRKKYNKNPTYPAAYVYDTIYLIAEASEIASEQGIPLQEALKKAEVDGVKGHLEFDSNRETNVEMYFVKINEQGKLTKL